MPLHVFYLAIISYFLKIMLAFLTNFGDVQWVYGENGNFLNVRSESKE